MLCPKIWRTFWKWHNLFAFYYLPSMSFPGWMKSKGCDRNSPYYHSAVFSKARQFIRVLSTKCGAIKYASTIMGKGQKLPNEASLTTDWLAGSIWKRRTGGVSTYSKWDKSGANFKRGNAQRVTLKCTFDHLRGCFSRYVNVMAATI